MLIPSSIVWFLAFIITLSLFFGTVVLLSQKGWEKPINRRFFVFAVFAALWQIVNLLMLIDVDRSLIWTRLSFTFGALGGFFLMYFVLIFPDLYLQKIISKLFVLINFVFLLICVYTSLTDKLVSEVIIKDNILLASYGGYALIFNIALILIFATIFFMAIYNYIKSDEKSREQVKTLFYGIGLTLLIIVFTDLLSPLIFGNDYLSNFGAFSMIFLFGFAGYAIVKHQLFDIKVILTETAVGVVIAAILVQVLQPESFSQRVLDFAILIVAIYGGYLIIKSVQKEIKQKEQLQDLTHQLAQANNHLKELDAMKTEFVSLASHELLTPVSAIEGYLSMLLDEKMAKVDDPKALKYLNNVYSSAKRLARLIADMLNISRIEEGRLLVEKADLDLTTLIEQVVDEVKFKADERKQKVVFAPESAEHFMSYGDADKIKEVIVNLVGNSIKYSRNPGTITITVKVAPTEQVKNIWSQLKDEIKARPLDDQESIKSAVNEHYRKLVGVDQLMISVKDEGIGIPREELPRLFKKFHRVGNYSTQESQGTGLGLYISRALTELQHGRIWADSEGEGKGSTFTFTLPTIAAKEQIIELEKEVPQDKEKLKPLAKPMKMAEEL